MSTAKQNRIRTWIFRALAPFAIVAAAASGAQASLVISTAPASNVKCSAGTCTATTREAVLNVVDLQNQLRRGDVRIDSGTAQAITVGTPIFWSQGSRLTLAAGTGITVSQPILVQGPGAVTMTTRPGAVAFVGRGQLDFWSLSSSLIINGKSYKLVNDLAALISAIAADPNGSFALARNYNAIGDATYTASPIYVLYGSLDGLGHRISNVKIQAAQGCAGFIAYLVQGSAPSVSNLTLAQIEVTQTPNGDGRSPNGVGGLAGCSQGTVSHVRVTGHVTGSDATSAGGIIGWQGSGPSGTGPISDSSAHVVVSGGMLATVSGGIVGFDDHGSLLRCAVAGMVSGDYAGGLVGLAQWDIGNIVGSWSAARVTGAGLAGGLVGWADGNFTLADNYASGAVSAGGGLIGKSTGGNTIARSYARGRVSGGGVTGNDDGTGVYTSVYWDMDTSRVTDPAKGVYNIPNEPGITGLNDTQLKAALPAGFDPAVWGQNVAINNGYPYLLANPPQ